MWAFTADLAAAILPPAAKTPEVVPKQESDLLADMARAERLAREARQLQRSALHGTALLLALVASGIWAAIEIFGWM